MSSCHRCGKPVYFAERKTSLGKEWHRACLKCEECGKVLNPGQHAEHKGQPYCHLPCYSLLFGPHITGYGVSAGAYNSYGDAGTMKKRIESYTIGGVDKEEILSKLQHYNDHYSGKNGQLDYKEVNGRLLISGLLRLHWRVDKQIQFAPKDDVPIAEKMSRACRKSYMMAINNGLDNMEPLQSFQIYDDTTPRRSPSKPLNGTTPTVAPPTDAPPTATPPRRERTGSSDDTIIMREKKSDIRRFHTVCYKGEKRKRYSINGHFYDSETSVFTPAHGTVTTVRVNSLNSTQEVIRALLDKFKVENKSDEFCLIEARRNGEMKRLLSTDYPLFERVLLGPQEDEAKIYIMESEAIAPVPQDVNQYASLPEALLRGFIGKLHGEEEEAANRIRTRFARYRDKLQLRLMEVTGQSEI